MRILGVTASSKLGIVLPPVAGYSLWLDGKDATQFTFSSGSVVSSWKDKSGNNYHFDQATVANQPTRAGTGLVSFDGSNDALVAGSKFMNNMHNGGANTLFIVFNSTSGNGGYILDTGAAPSTSVGFALINNAGAIQNLTRRGVEFTSSINAGANTRQADGVLGLGTMRIDADDGTAANRFYYYNKTDAPTQTNAQTNSPSGSSSTYNPGLGAGNAGTASFYSGSIGEVVWYTSDLSTVNRELVRDYLITKWSI
jgi:hypothetical protein